MADRSPIAITQGVISLNISFLERSKSDELAGRVSTSSYENPVPCRMVFVGHLAQIGALLFWFRALGLHILQRGSSRMSRYFRVFTVFISVFHLVKSPT